MRTGASGGCGYQTQDFSTATSTLNPNPTSNPAQHSSQANNTVDAHEHISPVNTGPELQSNLHALSKAKPRKKQKNTTTVSL